MGRQAALDPDRNPRVAQSRPHVEPGSKQQILGAANAQGELVTAPAPVKIIDKGLPGPGLLAQVVLSKYRDHCPLARQASIYRPSGRRALAQHLGELGRCRRQLVPAAGGPDPGSGPAQLHAAGR
jgi:hypothetical protein